MKLARRTLLAAFAGATMLSVVPAFAGTTVNVSLWDQGGAKPAMIKGLGYAMGGDMSKATMGVKASAKSAAAGDVTFNVTNTSKSIQHEMVVFQVLKPGTPLPYNKKIQRVKEGDPAAGYIGEVSETDPGKSGSVTLKLKPGLYLLACNIKGHYASGMWTELTVK